MEDVLIALRAVVALGAVLALLVFLSRRLQKSQAKGTSPLSELVPSRLAGWARRRAPRSGSARRPRAERISVVARAGLGGRAQLVVAEFGGIRYVLGVTEHGVSVVDTQETLAEVGPDELGTGADADAGDDADAARAGTDPDGEQVLRPVA
ncbi:flagellar biosynthetic protein FliO [Microbacterium sp. XT11]|uniref:flagellar biosynthetic protein FliO n=1 Tax=Microbacterium sp. XT11 TaxID=367477 RepID=UPI0008368B29|nr:flagellar biosynthetic protein FliO [Microbacterium sp. XT11]